MNVPELDERHARQNIADRELEGLGAFGRVWEGLGVCFAFFPAIVFFTLLHQFIRFRLSSPVPAASPRLSQTPDSRRSAGGWGLGVVSGRLRSR